MFIKPTDATEIANIIRVLEETCVGGDNISAKVVKCSFESFLEPLTHVLNLSLVQRTIPDELKVAKVIPLFKSDDILQIHNYRPISILPLFSKIPGKLMYERLLSDINKNNIVYDYQFGFRAKRGPNMTPILIVDRILQAIDNGEFVIGSVLRPQQGV